MKGLTDYCACCKNKEDVFRAAECGTAEVYDLYSVTAFTAYAEAGIKYNVIYPFKDAALTDKYRADLQKILDRGLTVLPALTDFSAASAELIDALTETGYKYKIPLFADVSRTLEEVGLCTEKHNGLTPPMLLHKFGFFDNGAYLCGCVHLDKEDAALIRQSGVSVVFTPMLSLMRGEGLPPLTMLLNEGVKVYLGSGAGADKDMLFNARLLYYTVLGAMNDSAAVSKKAVAAMIAKDSEVIKDVVRRM